MHMPRSNSSRVQVFGASGFGSNIGTRIGAHWTPAKAIAKANAAVNQALADPEMRERLVEMGGKPIPGTPEDFGKVIAAATEKWSKVVISCGAKAE
jgi:tripartite-type tricarboxylate transporter receptor subunit TctC